MPVAQLKLERRRLLAGDGHLLASSDFESDAHETLSTFTTQHDEHDGTKHFDVCSKRLAIVPAVDRGHKARMFSVTAGYVLMVRCCLGALIGTPWC